MMSLRAVSRGMAGASSRTFDLSQFKARDRRRFVPILRFMAALAIAFAAAGVPAGWFVASGVNSIFWVVFGSFVAGGCAPLLLFAAVRPWRFVRTLEVSDDGFSLTDSSNRSERHLWNQPDLALVLTTNPGPIAATPLMGTPAAWWLASATGRIGTYLTEGARLALIDSATAHGLFSIDQEYDDLSRGGIQSRVREFILSHERLPDGARPLDGGASAALELPAEFDLTRPSTGGGASFVAVNRGAVHRVVLTDSRLSITDATGKVSEYDWRSPALSIRLGRTLATVATPIRSPSAVWRMTLAHPTVHGEVPTECYLALLAMADRLGLRSTTQKSLLPGGRGPTVWVVSTSISAPGLGPNKR